MTGRGMRVGVDIGGTKTDAVAIADDGRIEHRLRLPTGFGAEAVIESTVDAVVGLAARAGSAIADFGSIGIGIPGAVDNGVVSHAVNLGVDGLDLGTALNGRFGRSVRIDNDVKAAALGAFHLLNRGESQSMAYLNLGTGLAAGLVLGGTLWRGSRGTAGEIGHIPIDPAGPECRCGQRGCLETLASGSAIARQWPTTDRSPASALFEAAASGDGAAVEVRQRLFENVAAAVRVLVLTVDVDSVVIGGGIASLGAELGEGIVAVLESWERRSSFLASLDLSRRVEVVPLAFPAAAVGAALVGVG